MSDPVDDPLPRLREICLRLPKMTERLDAYRVVAPAKLIAQVDSGGPVRPDPG